MNSKLQLLLTVPSWMKILKSTKAVDLCPFTETLGSYDVGVGGFVEV